MMIKQVILLLIKLTCVSKFDFVFIKKVNLSDWFDVIVVYLQPYFFKLVFL